MSIKSARVFLFEDKKNMLDINTLAEETAQQMLSSHSSSSGRGAGLIGSLPSSALHFTERESPSFQNTLCIQITSKRGRATKLRLFILGVRCKKQ